MDPLSIAVSVGSLLAATVTVGRAVNDLRGYFSRADGTVTAISAECTLINTTLLQISNFASNDPANFAERLKPNNETPGASLNSQVQNALECCDVTLIALSDVLKKCTPKKDKGMSAFKGKAMFFLNESELKDRLQTLRNLNQAMVGLVTAMQAYGRATFLIYTPTDLSQ